MVVNPRHRRLLIPGLLIALIVIAVIATIRDAEAADDSASSSLVSAISDPRITEASGMAISRTDDDLAYLINDSDQAQAVYAVEISSGDVVGTTTVTGGTWVDSEALTIDPDGRLWVADTGDNRHERTDAALYAFDEPGRGDHSASAERFPLNYDGSTYDVESVVADPRDGRKYLVTKGVLGGKIFRLPADPSSDRPNDLELLSGAAQGPTTDATFSADGKRAYLLSLTGRVDEFTVRQDEWAFERSFDLPALEQPETIAAAHDGSALFVGSEGENSPLLKLQVPRADTPEPKPAPTDEPESEPEAADAAEAEISMWWWIGGGAVVVAVAGLIGAAWLRSRARSGAVTTDRDDI